MPFISINEQQPIRKGIYKVYVKGIDGSIDELVGDRTGTDFRPYIWDWQKGDAVIVWFKS